MYCVNTFKSICNFNTVQIIDGSNFSIIDIPKKGITGIIFISQSGETKDLHRCLELCKENDIITIGVINVVDSLIAREVLCGVYLNAGKEVAVASTKAFTCQAIVLNLIAIWFSQNKSINKTKRLNIISSIRILPYNISNILSD